MRASANFPRKMLDRITNASWQLRSYDGLKKDLELTLDEHLAANSDRYSSDPKLAPYFQSRNRSIGSPIKKDAPEFKIPKRRMGSKTDSEIIAATAV